MNAVSIPETLVYIMVSISAVDNKMDESELARIGNIVKVLPVFQDYNSDQLVNSAKACTEILQHDEGLETILSLAGDLPPRLQETAYAIAAEIAASDQQVASEEIRFLQLLRSRLSVDKLTCAALERAAQARNQRI